MISAEFSLLALADRNRLHLLRLLLAGPLSVGEMTRISGLGQSLVSHHLAVLVRDGWLSAERQGRRRIYSVRATARPLRSLARWIRHHVELPPEWEPIPEPGGTPATDKPTSGDLEDYLL